MLFYGCYDEPGCIAPIPNGGETIDIADSAPPERLIFMKDYRYDEKDTAAAQLWLEDRQLFFSGMPVGLAQVTWFLNANTRTYALSEHMDGATLAPWAPSYYATGALTGSNGYLYTSGSVGLSVFSAHGDSLREEARYPMPDSAGNIAADADFVFKGLVVDDEGSTLVGVGEDFFSRIPILADRLDITARVKTSFACAPPSCEVYGATRIGKALFVALGGKVGTWLMGETGNFTRIADFSIHATAVAASARHFFAFDPALPNQISVYHARVSASTADLSRESVLAADFGGEVTSIAVNADESMLAVTYHRTAVRVFRMAKAQ